MYMTYMYIHTYIQITCVHITRPSLPHTYTLATQGELVEPVGTWGWLVRFEQVSFTSILVSFTSILGLSLPPSFPPSLYVSKYIHTYICMYVYVCTHTHTHTHTHTQGMEGTFRTRDVYMLAYDEEAPPTAEQAPSSASGGGGGGRGGGS